MELLHVILLAPRIFWKTCIHACYSIACPAHYKIIRKCKGHPRTDHEGPEGEYRYSSTLPLTSALDGVGGQRHAPAALPPGETR